ncbi:glycosyltransferase [Symmachiella macrocystis]|nr:glycosyltransferase [Symmachiella macrocystis]
MPVYNRQEYVRKAVESILTQSFTDFEFIIVNDGSTDSATEILHEFATRDTRIVLIEQSNSGYVRALNRGLDVARGQFVARMDSDDISLPDRLANQVRYLQRHSEVVAVGGQAIKIDQRGDCFGSSNCPLLHDEIDTQLLQHVALGHKITRGTLFHPTIMLRSVAIQQVGKYRPDFEPAEDRDLWLRLSEIGKLANLPQFLLKYRVHSDMVSHARRSEQNDNALLAIADAYRRRGQMMPSIPKAMPTQQSKPSYLSDEARAMSAARSGFFRTANKYALWVLWRRPWRLRAWQALVMSCTGRTSVDRWGD